MTILAKPGAMFRAMLRDGRGIAAAEFALIAPVMLTMLFGVYDLGNAIQERLQLEQAVRAGGQFALSWPDQTGGIADAIQAALPATGRTITPSARRSATVEQWQWHHSVALHVHLRRGDHEADLCDDDCKQQCVAVPVHCA